MAADSSEPAGVPSRAVALSVLVAALGYFVDIYDLVLFSVVRTKSLVDIGVPRTSLLDVGADVINAQMAGMLVGGVLWGVLGDRRGRLSVLYGSILMYSLANLANARVGTVVEYRALRFVAGVGLAGELGAGVTLVSEIMGRHARGWGTTVVASMGIVGGVVAGLVGDLLPWRAAYVVGGGLGLALLVLRVGVRESAMFQKVREDGISRGDFLLLFRSGDRLMRYLSVIAVGLPIWYTVGLLITFSPEFGAAAHMTELPTGGRAILFCYAGLAVGDLASGALSQVLRTRRRAVALFLVLTSLSAVAYFVAAPRSLVWFYGVCTLLGFSTGYWAVFVTVASEQFGTNLRSTVTTTVPNFVRGAVVPITLAFKALKPTYGVRESAIAVGLVVLVIAAAALAGLAETYGRDLDFVERS